MHGSAHDKAQQQPQCGVLLRCGKCVQRTLRGVVTRLRTRRTLVATAALLLVLLLLLALLALCHAQLLSLYNDYVVYVAIRNAPHVAASPTDRWLLRPDTQHGGSVRVMLLMVSTRVDAQLCYALASAYFADLPVVVLGYGGEYKSHIWRWQVYLDAIERAGLRDRDVVLLLDSDILFSGEDMLPFIDDYIARSPATPSALDVRAVRAGTARAPSMFAAEVFCAAQHFANNRSACATLYDAAEETMAAYIARTGVAYDLHNEAIRPLRYLNGGVSIHRVWSVRAVKIALYKYVTTHKPMLEGSNGWHDDQSVFALFYNDLRAWEVEHDVLRTNSTAAATQRGPHGLRAGQLQLEQTGRMTSLVYDTALTVNVLTSAAWYESNSTALHLVQYDSANVAQYSDDVWRRYGGSVRLQRRTLTRAGNTTHTIDLTPPLLYVDSYRRKAERQARDIISPLVLHFTEGYKPRRMRRAAQLLPWYMPMRYNTTRWQQGRAHLLTSFIDAWTVANNAKRVRYGDVCRNVALTQTDLRSFWCALTSLC